MEELAKISPNKEKARSLLRMVETTIEMIRQIDKSRFPSNIAREYYEVIRELMSAILALDGYKTVGESAHKRIIEYLGLNYKQFDKSEISLIDELRMTRNKIAYDGFFVKEDYIDRKRKDILELVEKLRRIVEMKLR